MPFILALQVNFHASLTKRNVARSDLTLLRTWSIDAANHDRFLSCHTRWANEFPGTHVYAEQSVTSDRIYAFGRMAPGSKTSQWITGNRSIPGRRFRDMELTLKTGRIQPPNFRRLIALAADVSDVRIIENNRLRTIGQMSNSSDANADARPIQPSASSAKTDSD